VREKKNKNDPTSMHAAYPIIGMNLSSSQMELVHSWGWVTPTRHGQVYSGPVSELNPVFPWFSSVTNLFHV